MGRRRQSRPSADAKGLSARGSRRSVQPALRRTFVLEAATYAFANSGPDATTIEEIAQAAGVNKRYIYEMFSGKEALFEAVVEREVQRGVTYLLSAFAEAVRCPPKEAVRRQYAAIYEYASRYPERARVIQLALRLWSPNINEIVDRGRDMLLRGHLELWRRYHSGTGAPSETAAEMLSTMLFGMAEALLVRVVVEDRFDGDRAVDMLTEFTIGGVSWLTNRAGDVWTAADDRAASESA